MALFGRRLRRLIFVIDKTCSYTFIYLRVRYCFLLALKNSRLSALFFS